MDILILGANGFIGSHLCEAILKKTDWRIFALDIAKNNLNFQHERLNFLLGDMSVETKWIDEHIAKSAVVIPLAAIANPLQYVENPVKVFELDFEANLRIIRQCKNLKTRIIFPSTSEVYGMCKDDFFDEEKSPCVTGSIHKERWIYANTKQLLDRMIYAYGKHEGLKYTIFRPFNWYGPRLDNIASVKGARVMTQFIGNILRQEPIFLSDGGTQKRAFTYIDDGIDALLKIIENKNNNASQKIFNIGNPHETISIAKLAELIISVMREFSYAFEIPVRHIKGVEFYGEGYEDILHRAPSIAAIEKCLGWKPEIGLREGLRDTMKNFFS